MKNATMYIKTGCLRNMFPKKFDSGKLYFYFSKRAPSFQVLHIFVKKKVENF